MIYLQADKPVAELARLLRYCIRRRATLRGQSLYEPRGRAPEGLRATTLSAGELSERAASASASVAVTYSVVRQVAAACSV